MLDLFIDTFAIGPGPLIATLTIAAGILTAMLIRNGEK